MSLITVLYRRRQRTWIFRCALVIAAMLCGCAGSAGPNTSKTLAASNGSAPATATTPASLASITVSPANPVVTKGGTQQFSATGSYSDGSTHDLTDSVAWTSSNSGVATISNTGLASSIGSGSVTIQAAWGGVSGSAILTVTPMPTISVTISPGSVSVQAGATQPFTATVTNDAQNQGVTWSLSGTGCSGAACGSLSANASASGEAITYAAPAAVPATAQVTLTASSVSDSTQSSAATISITPATTTPTGSTFTESFGDSANPCWTGGPSSCDQMWVAQGSAQSIVATPGSPAPNTAGANSLQMMEPAGSAGYIYTTGSFPRVPYGTPFDLYFTLDVTSQAMHAYDLTRLITVANDVGGTEYPAQISFGFDGTHFQLQAGGSSFTSNVNLSLNAWHTVQLHLAPGTNASFMGIDGGAPNTFTEDAKDFAYLVVGDAGGQPDAMTYYVGNVYVNSALGGGPPPSAYIDFETSSDGTMATPAILAASTHCGNGIWSSNIMPLTGLAISASGQKQLAAPVTACGTQYSDAAGTRGLRYDISQTNQYASYNWSSTSNSASVGFYFMITVSDQNFYTVLGIRAGGGDYAAAHIQGGGLALETVTGLSNTIPVSPNVWYWITMQYNSGGTHYMQVYDTNTWALLGSVSRAATGNNQPISIDLGRPGSETGYPSAYWYYDNIVIDYLTAKFPIVPPSY